MKFKVLKKLLIILEDIYEIGASIVKWAILDLGRGLSESDSNLYIYFKICGKMSCKHLQSILNYKTNKFVLTRKFKRNIHSQNDNTSDVQVGDIEKILSKFCQDYDKSTSNLLSTTLFFDDALKFKLNSNNIKKLNSKYLRSWNSCPKPNRALCFWTLLLIIGFEDPIFVFYNWVLNTTIWMPSWKTNSNLNNVLIVFNPKTMIFSIPEHFFGPLYHACTIYLKLYHIKNWKTTTCKWEDFEILGFWPTMSKDLFEH